MNPMWTLPEGLALVRELQPGTREFGYHLDMLGDQRIDVFIL